MIKPVLVLLALLPAVAAGHGENRQGPHGGYVRMPGAFHTELVPLKGAFRVYLLDIQFQNPVVENSAVHLVIKQGSHINRVTCRAQRTAFHCPLRRLTLRQGDAVEVHAKRQDLEAEAPAVYTWPLQIGTPGSP